MNTRLEQPPQQSKAAWRLWVDRCGGFGLLNDGVVRLGGKRPDSDVEIQVAADWRRDEGTLVRHGRDFFWVSREGKRALARDNQALPIKGTAEIVFATPSPLSGTAVLSLKPPHRFDGHLDQWLLVERTVLIGPDEQNHIRCPSLSASAVLVFREGIWQAKQKTSPGGKAEWVSLEPGARQSIGDIDLLLEKT
ncbi:MAG: hypothetical protein AAFV88_24105 [Planctomycetota bacterium]